MTSRRVFVTSLFLLAAVPALRAAAIDDNVVTIDVGKVSLPVGMPGLCDVSGIIGKVWRGQAFHVGQPIALKVPCSSGASYLAPAGLLTRDEQAHYSVIAADVLLKSRQGVARLDDSGALIWKVTDRSYGTMGAVWGYRVLDGAAVPAAPL